MNVVIQTKERDSYSHELEVISEVTAREVDDSEKGATGKDQCSKVKEYVPCIPYPARLKQTFKENNYGKLEKLFDKLHLSLPFFVVVSQMTKREKCLKELLSTEVKLKEVPKEALKKEIPTIMHENLAQKLKDPGSFTIPCIIGNLSIDQALADAGASVNVMPYKLFQRLNLGELKPACGSLQFADRSVKMPRGVIEDVLVSVGHLVFPVDFVVLDIEEDARVPIILGRPFLATSQAIMDMKDGKLTLRVGKDELVVKVFSMKEEQLGSTRAFVSSAEVTPFAMFSIHDLICRNVLEFGKRSKEEVEIPNPKVLESMIPLGVENRSLKKMGFEVITQLQDPGDQELEGEVEV